MVDLSYSSDKLTGLILAGGKSSRMKGHDKTLVEVGGKPMIERVRDTLTPLVGEVIVACGQCGRFHDLEGTRPVPDAFPNIGPLAGILAGLQASTTDWVFAVASDMPYLNPGLITEILSRRKEGLMAVVPKIGDNYEPLHAAYHRDLIPHIDTLISSGGRKIRRVLEDQPVHWLELDPCNADHFFNVNSPEDLEVIALTERREED